jgi:hypothetical protein
MRRIKQIDRPFIIRYKKRLYDSAATLSEAVARVKQRNQPAEIYNQGRLILTREEIIAGRSGEDAMIFSSADQINLAYVTRDRQCPSNEDEPSFEVVVIYGDPDAPNFSSLRFIAGRVPWYASVFFVSNQPLQDFRPQDSSRGFWFAKAIWEKCLIGRNNIAKCPAVSL